MLCLAWLALPGLNTFVSEFLVLIGTFTRYPVAAGFAAAGIILLRNCSGEPRKTWPTPRQYFSRTRGAIAERKT